MKPYQINPFTGLVEHATHSRGAGQVGPAVELSQQVYEVRRLAPLRRNADLFGLRPEDLERLVWKPGKFRGSRSDLGGSSARGSIPCPSELQGLLHKPNCWDIVVVFQRDGVVSNVNIRRRGPPVPICTAPAITEAQARGARSLFDASLQKQELGHAVGFKVTPEQIEDAKLAIIDGLENNEGRQRARSATWRLVWTLKVSEPGSPRSYAFSVDAVTNQLVKVMPTFVE